MFSVKEINILVVHVHYLLLKNPQREFSHGENKMEKIVHFLINESKDCKGNWLLDYKRNCWRCFAFLVFDLLRVAPPSLLVFITVPIWTMSFQQKQCLRALHVAGEPFCSQLRTVLFNVTENFTPQKIRKCEFLK